MQLAEEKNIDFDLIGLPTGTITVEELKEGMEQIGEKLTEMEMKEMLSGVKLDANEEITFQEFAKMVLDEYPNHY